MSDSIQDAITAAAAEIEEELGPEEVRTWTIVSTDSGGHALTTKCPWCDALGEIYEHDTAIRWNLLYLNSQRKGVASTGDADWESDGWICGNCGSQALDSPPDFEITEWH